MNLGFEERVVLVTGGSRGIGRAAALKCARERARIAISYFSERARADAVVNELRGIGADAIAVRLDLADGDSIRAAVAEVTARWGRVDVLVNNAVQWGTLAPWQAPPFEEVEEMAWRPTLQTNIEGHIRAIQCVLPGMRARAWGRIVNVSSSVAADGLPGATAYAAAKAALHGLTRTLAKELGPSGILVNAVMPGLTLTERNLERMPPAVRDPIAATTPLRRLLGPDEVAATIAFLASAANTAVTGEIVRASGGAM